MSGASRFRIRSLRWRFQTFGTTALFDIDYAFKERYDETGRLYEWENTILPDVYVYQDIEDIRQGRDSVMEWVLAQ